MTARELFNFDQFWAQLFAAALLSRIAESGPSTEDLDGIDEETLG